MRQTARNRDGRNRGRRSQQPKRTDGSQDACYPLCPGAFCASVRSAGASSGRNAIRPACPYEHPAEDVPGDGPPGQGERQLGGGTEGLAAKRAKAVGAVSQATGQLHGALQGVDAVETMVADVQGGAAVLAGVASRHRAPGAGKPYTRARRDALAISRCLGTCFPHPIWSAAPFGLLPSRCLRTRDAVFRVTEDGVREGLVGHDT